MSGWLPEGTAEWGGRPIARSVADALPRCRALLSGSIRVIVVHRPGAGDGLIGRAIRGVSVDGWLDDGTGTMVLRWLGRESVPGLIAGVSLTAEGTVVEVHGRPMILNPLYRFDPVPPAAVSSGLSNLPADQPSPGAPTAPVGPSVPPPT